MGEWELVVESYLETILRNGILRELYKNQLVKKKKKKYWPIQWDSEFCTSGHSV